MSTGFPPGRSENTSGQSRPSPAGGREDAVSLDRPCARRLCDLTVGTEECSRRGSNQRMEPTYTVSKEIADLCRTLQPSLYSVPIRTAVHITSTIDQLDWFSAREEGLGKLYVGLLEKNAADKKSGAGQYFTPRPLIDCIVRLMKPQPGEVMQDPAAGTAGFLVAADRYIKDRTDDLYKLSQQQGFFQRHNAVVGAEP